MRQRLVASCLVVASAAACATPAQVQRVEAHVGILESKQAHSDSVRDAESARLVAAQQRVLDSLLANVQSLQESIARNGRETAAQFTDMRQVFSQILAMTGMNAQQMSRALAAIDAARTPPPPPPPLPGDTTTHTGAPPAPPSIDALLENGREALLKGSNGAAQLAFHMVVQVYPTSPAVATALLNLGRSFDPADPDSAKSYYLQVVKSYPDSAAPALYKLAQIEERKTPPNISGAKAYYQQIVVDRYKSSDEYGLAADWLKAHP